MTIAGVNAVVAAGIVAAIGDVSRFREPQKLVSYFGLNLSFGPLIAARCQLPL
nr:transposase [Aurantimonas sp. DM33-3]